MSAATAILVATMSLGQAPADPAPPPPPAETPAPVEAPAPPPPSPVAVPFPHPMISEVLFAVPTGPAGDANKDGTRHVNGDEFFEIVNPHDKPIQLFGYSVIDLADPGNGQVKFVFPALELPARAVAVVFNGNGCTWAAAGPVGDSRAAPTGPSDKFEGAFVFTMRIQSQRQAFSNEADSVTLLAPDGKPVHRVAWSKDGPVVSAPGAAAPLLDEIAAVVSRASIQRDGIAPGGAFLAHTDLPGQGDSLFSPGLFRTVGFCPVVPEPPFTTPEPDKPQQPEPAHPAIPVPVLPKR